MILPLGVCRLLVSVMLVCGLAAAAAAVEPIISPEAKRHVDAGVEHYEAGRYQNAIDEFDLAYRLSHRPALLFNIARAEAKLGHEEAAIAFLRRYLEERPDANDAAAVLAEIEAHEQAIKSAKAQKEAEAEAAAARSRADELTAQAARHDEEQRRAEAARVVAPPPAPVAAPADRRVPLRRAGLALVIVGPLLIGTGIGLGAVAADAANTVQGQSGDFTQCCSATDARGRASDAAGIALDVIGGVAAVTGAVLLGLGYRKQAARSSASRATVGVAF